LNSPVLKNYRGRFPFKLATTSYIYPDEIAPNVARLASSFDEIELVFFESKGQNCIPDKAQINKLMKFSRLQQLSFNVHLPIDISLGDECEEVRARGTSIVKMVIERTLGLNPSLYTLHLDLRDKNGQEEKDIEGWRLRLAKPDSISPRSWSVARARTAAATQPNSTKTQFSVCSPLKM